MEIGLGRDSLPKSEAAFKSQLQSEDIFKDDRFKLLHLYNYLDLDEKKPARQFAEKYFAWKPALRDSIQQFVEGYNAEIKENSSPELKMTM